MAPSRDKSDNNDLAPSDSSGGGGSTNDSNGDNNSSKGGGSTKDRNGDNNSSGNDRNGDNDSSRNGGGDSQQGQQPSSNDDSNNNGNNSNNNNNNNNNKNKNNNNNNNNTPNSGRDGNNNNNNNGNGNGNGNGDSSRSSGRDKNSSKSNSISSSSSSSPESGNSSNEAATLIGVLVGVGVLIIVFVAICVLCCRRKRKSPPSLELGRHTPDLLKGQQSAYNNNNNWYNSTNSSGAMPPPGGWAMPPPPPGMMSGEMSGLYTSGPMGPPAPPPHPGLSLGFSKSSFSSEELATATQGFSQANMLGQGGFGFVHKGVLPNKMEVAVKSLKAGSGQGEREFQAEVEIISRVHHRHLVSLVGYCIGAGGQRMLVYEFVPNKTLEFHLHGKGQPVMDFETRHKIALGSAKGLAYLHEDCHPRIIHRDIKTANILIDYSFEAKVADFGLAKLSSDTYTHVSTRVMGTFGYLAPEYAASGKLTDKSDVFSYGVMLLELITGRRPINPTGDEDSLVDWARPQLMRALDEARFEGIVDPRLENNFNAHEMTRMVACAAASIRHSAKRRPRMSQIVRALEGDLPLDVLNGEGAMKPGQSTHLGIGGNYSSDYDANAYKDDMKKFMTTMNEEDYSSSDYTSSEYGSRNYK